MPKNYAFIVFCYLLFLPCLLFSQSNSNNNSEDAFYIRSIYDVALTKGQSYNWLYHLTENIGARLGGSPQAAAAVEFTKQILDTLGLDKVWLQPCTVPHWVRGEKEEVKIVNSKKRGSLNLNALALGNSIGTPPEGITAEVIEVRSLDEVEKLGRQKIEGKIVFYNRPMDPTNIRTSEAYGGAVDQRGSGPSKAAEFGAVGTLVRSMTTRTDDVPHTGGLSYKDGIPKIPAIAISTIAADLLSELLKEETINVFMKSNCQLLADKLSYNVIAEWTGSEYPEEIILVGGHLDSWDVGSGAHDDGSGCVQSMEVLQLFKRLNYKPKRTIRCVLFMNEENGLAGAKAYQKVSNEKGEFHLAAIESDRGGFTPRGFSCEGDESIFVEKFKSVTEWLPLLEPYGIQFRVGGSGADVSGLKSQKGLLFGLDADSQRYFDYHHTHIDLFEAVNKRELELGAAAMTSLVYLIDKYGLD